MPKLNFFTPFVQKEKSVLQSKGVIVLIVVLLTAGAYGFLQFKTYLLEKNIAEKEQELNKIKTAQLSEVMEIKRKISDQKDYLQKANNLEEEFLREDFIKLSLIEKILNAVPQDLFFQNLTINKVEGDIKWDLFGYAEKRQTIAELQYNLKKSGLVNKIEISSINNKPIENKGNFYAFSMSGTFNLEVAEHENR